MPQDLLTALIGVCLVGALSYITNQLPALRQFRGSGVLLVLLAIELLLLAWIWQVSSDGDELYQAHQALFDDGKLVLLGASGVTLLLLVVGLLGDRSQTVNAPQLNLRDRLLQAELEEVEKRQDDSLHHQILIDLGMTDEREQVGRPSKQLITDGTAVSLPAATQMVEVFRRKEVGGRLLILGEPGAGKTTMLLELAKSLLEAGQQDPNAPVPVILELSTWREDQSKTLADWLVKQICKKYRQSFNQRTCYEWLESGQILPLLDGLDELGNRDRQEKAITAINNYLELDATLKLAVCCRWENYQESQSQITQLNGAVRLQPLTNAQVQDYLWQLSRGNLWSHIRRDTTLLELARMPLFLHMMVVTYQEVQPFHSQADLFDAYILRRFELPVRKQVYSASQQEPSQQETRHYLVWLAKQMQQQNQTEFLIERLPPSWLSPFEQSWYYTLPLTLLFVVLPMLGFGVLIFSGRSAVLSAVLNDLSSMQPFERTVYILQRIAALLALIFSGILSIRSSSERFSSIHPLETIQISIERPIKILIARSLVFSSAIGLTTWLAGTLIGQRPESALVAGGVSGLIFAGIFTDDPSWLETVQLIKKYPEEREYIRIRFRFSFLLYLCFGWGGGIVISHPGVLIGGWKGGLVSGLLGLLGALVISGKIEVKTILDTRNSPNQGMKASVRNATVFMALALIFLLIIWHISSDPSVLFGQEPSASLSFLAISLIVFLMCGGFASVQHFILRLILWCNGSTPWDYAKFLAYAAELRLIQQVGGRYRFIHRLLRDHFAEMW